jgi:hypothetical protein
MTRILTDIPEQDLVQLDALATREKRSRAAAIRDAIRLYLVQNSGNNDWIARGAGYWKAPISAMRWNTSAPCAKIARPTKTSDRCRIPSSTAIS